MGVVWAGPTGNQSKTLPSHRRAIINNGGEIECKNDDLQMILQIINGPPFDCDSISVHCGRVVVLVHYITEL